DEHRTGGTTAGATLPGAGPFPVTMDTRRADAGGTARLRLGPTRTLALRASVSEEWRTPPPAGGPDRGGRGGLVGEATWREVLGRHVVVVGAAVQRDAWSARDVPAPSYDFVAPGVFVEDSWFPTSRLGFDTSARYDQHSEYGAFVSPRVSARWRLA